MVLKLSDIEPLQVQAHSSLYSVRSMRTNVSVSLCDPETLRPYWMCEAFRFRQCSMSLYLKQPTII